MLWHRFGTGKVLQLNFDETWRLRYGIGDRLHHEFWGQIIRWAVSDRLSAGTDLVRLGTDRTLYKSGEVISVQARLLNADRSPVMDAPVQARIVFENEVIRTIDLIPHPQNLGMLHGEVRDLTQPGKYHIELSGESSTSCWRLKRRELKRWGWKLESKPLPRISSDLTLWPMTRSRGKSRTGPGGTVADFDQCRLSALELRTEVDIRTRTLDGAALESVAGHRFVSRRAEFGVDTPQMDRANLGLQKRGQEPIAKWPEGGSAPLVPDPFSEARRI